MFRQFLSTQADANDVKLLAPIVADIRQGKGVGEMPFLSLPNEYSDIADILALAIRYREHCDHVVLCGTGGSSLGAVTLSALTAHPLGLPRQGFPQLHVAESTDSEMMHSLLQHLPPERTGWIFISKSGNTLETLTQYIAYLEWQKHHGPTIATVITMPGERPLRTLAERYGTPILDHPPELGGRFSVLSLVGLLPAAIAGLDIAAIRYGAASMLKEKGLQMAVQAASWHRRSMSEGKTIQIVMPYARRLQSWMLWYRQLWAESLGKDGKGSTPLAAMGPVDQHSMLQLFLDGPADKCVTLVQVGNYAEDRALRVPKELDEYRYLSAHTGLDVINAQARGTLAALSSRNIPVREVRISELDEYTLGKLLMLGMLETVLTAELLGVNAFDQPAVEAGKRIAYESLQSAPAEPVSRNVA